MKTSQRLVVIVGAVAIAAGVAVLNLDSKSLPSLASLIPRTLGASTSVTGVSTSGGQAPTSFYRPPAGTAPLANFNYFPDTPSLRLETTPAGPLNLGDRQSAYWKVWWIGTMQQSVSVSLVSHSDSADATSTPASLNARNLDPQAFNTTASTYTTAAPIAITGIPGALGYSWSGVLTQGTNSTPLTLQFAVFSRGSVAAIVAVTSYGASPPSDSTLQGISTEEFNLLPASSVSLGLLLCGVALVLAGLAMVVPSVILQRRRGRSLAVGGAAYGSAQYPVGTGPWPPGQPAPSGWGEPPPPGSGPSGWGEPPLPGSGPSGWGEPQPQTPPPSWQPQSSPPPSWAPPAPPAPPPASPPPSSTTESGETAQ